MYAPKAPTLLFLLLASSMVDARLSHKSIREIRNDMLVYRNTIMLDSRQGPSRYL